MWIADLHIHSRYSRATSGDCDAPHLDLWARNKGIALVGTGDFTHPQWRGELAEMLIEDGDGLYRLREEYRLPCAARNAETPRFAVTGEISTIYKRNGKTRKVHHLILLPSLEAAENLSHRLEAIGNLHSDGRPILGLDSRDLLSIVLESCPEAIYVPAHIWTPHFSLFGAFSGFDSMEACYGDLTPYIHALETGLSSDPPMNRRLSALDGHVLVSNSDAHSPQKLGREANLLSCPMSFPGLKKALDTGEGFAGTLEFYPEEGKYHLDGHRSCHCRLTPAETKKFGGVCPVCGKKVTVGVLSRVEALADRPAPDKLDKPFESLIPLPELLAEAVGASAASKKTQAAYDALLKRLGPEFYILREAPLSEVEEAGGFLFMEAVRRLRADQVIRQGGFDGEYGVIRVFSPGERETLLGQTALHMELPAQEAEAPAPMAQASAPKAPLEKTMDDAPNPEQQEAIQARESTVAVMAGPGTGKTKTLVNRVAWLIESKGVSPRAITAVTFTRQASREMLERLEKKLGKQRIKGLTVGTFHAVCLSLIEKKPLISRELAREIVSSLLQERGESLSPAQALAAISARKNGLSAPGLPPGLLELYDERLKSIGARDLDDVLLEALCLPDAPRAQFQYLLVDEYQDVNGLQRALVRKWSREGSLFVIGDPDQSIYGFRGADAACFDDLIRERPDARVIRLKRNYRSTPQILSCAAAVFDNPRDRALIPALPPGDMVRFVQAQDERGQYIWIAKEIARLTGGIDMLEARQGERARYAFSEIAVLCRTHRQLEWAESCLRHDGIPCAVSGRGAYLENEKNQGLIAFFTALEEPANRPAAERALGGLWRCPDGLALRAGDAMALLPNLDEFSAALSPFDALTPFAEAVAALYPIRKKKKPRALLADLAERTGTRGREIESLLNAAVFFDAMPDFLEALRQGEEGDIQRLSGGKPSGAVRLMTLHAAKGLEFPAVFLAGLDEDRLPLRRAGEEVNEEEEKRLFYVGVTRAKRTLILTSGDKPSPFLRPLLPMLRQEAAGVRLRRPEGEQMSFLSL